MTPPPTPLPDDLPTSAPPDKPPVPPGELRTERQQRKFVMPGEYVVFHETSTTPPAP